MRGTRSWTSTLALLALLLPGCAGGSGGEVPQDDAPELVATDTTGVIRAVVVDEAIRPLAGADVAVKQGTEVLKTMKTNEDGFAGFEGLAPGTYFLEASKLGYATTQQSVEVVAGVPNPPVAKLQLQVRSEGLPFVQSYKIDGFLECSAVVANVCFIANFYPCLVMQAAGQACTGNLTNDNSYFTIDVLSLNRVPDWFQLEMVWDSTQALGSEMNVRLDFLSADSLTIDNSTSETGPSPLLLAVEHADLLENEIGTTRQLAIETFHGGVTGVTLQQRFSDFVHVFYGYQPPEGWRFSETGEVPPPE